MGLGRAAVENLCRAMLQDTIIRDYINAGPPFLGESHFKDKDCVKTLGARWNCENKKWVACNKQVLAKLIRSTKWLPTGFTQNESIDILQIIEKAFAPVAANCEEMLFDRRAKGNNTIDHRKDMEIAFNGTLCTYTHACDECGVLLDSRLQFGLECDCPFRREWKMCVTCFVPIREETTCQKCV